MIRFAWLRFRPQAAVAFGLLAIAAVPLAVTGPGLAHVYDTTVATCRLRGDCAAALSAFPPSGDRALDTLARYLLFALGSPPGRNVASITEVGSGAPGGAHNGSLFVQTQPDIPGAWILSSQVITPAGRPASGDPATGACAGPSSTGQSCSAYLETLHLRQEVTYQPLSRYWVLRWYESAIFLALALILAGFCSWWIRRSSEGRGIRLRTSQRAPALQRSA